MELKLNNQPNVILIPGVVICQPMIDFLFSDMQSIDHSAREKTIGTLASLVNSSGMSPGPNQTLTAHYKMS